MGPIDTTVAQRPPLPQAGAASSGLMTQDDLLKNLSNEVSLSEGMVQRRQQYASTGQGGQIYDVLKDPNKVMVGLNPNANLESQASLGRGFQESIDSAKNYRKDILSQIASILAQQKQEEKDVLNRAEQIKQRKFENSLKLVEANKELRATNQKMLDDGTIVGLSEEELKNKPISSDDKEAEDAARGISQGLMSLADIPIKERTRVANKMQEMGLIDVDTKISTLRNVQQKKKITDLTPAVIELKKLKDNIEAITGKPGGIGSLSKGITGPISGLIGDIYQSEDIVNLRSQIGAFKDAIKKDLFGTAFTAAEKADASLPDQKKQENKNISIINVLYNRKIDELITNMKNAGLSDDEVNKYLQQNGIDSIPTESKVNIDKKLKDAGYSDSDIAEYKKAKGIK